ncbi:hypothetical protein PC112_g3623 [Phytophthora cactorum]|nr:hypothetical protein PC112_g3623 [Phytophthora cactorum]
MYMREVVGPGIGCGVNDYSGEYMNRELYKSNRERSSDPECSRYASMMLTNVSAHRQNHLVVVERHALRPLRALCLTPNLECQRSAALALYNVSCAQANQLKLSRRD